MNARRTAAALAVSVVLGTAGAPAAFADGSPSPKPAGGPSLPKALYGDKDPQYDGVWRQSLTILAQHSVGLDSPAAAVDWLAGQQCADGGFTAYRADAKTPCDPKKGEFTDATAAAVQALAAAGGRGAVVDKGVDWLKQHQNKDGGWGLNPGSPSDANSTAAAIGAFAATEQDPAKATTSGGKSPYDALFALQLGCDAKKDERGAFAYLPEKDDALHPDALASSAATLAATGHGFAVRPADKDVAIEAPSCAGSKGDDKASPDRAGAADSAAAYLSATLAANGQHLKSVLPGQKGQPDVGGTIDAVLALAAGGHREAAAKPLHWLMGKDAGAVAWAKGQPAALAKLVLATRAAGGDPRDFAGTDLVRELNATGPAASAPSADATEKNKEKDDDNGGGVSVWWVVAVGAVAGIGIGFLLSGRKKK
ncbi:prenyltransferase/squalene oxidase repeat-containing protein [Streptomyces palmae]|uniref:Squalene cyclase C-terminal domain-containing protein n=1 Tax=Streptomyces palmae TaxID=1701085 RepID=A0A4Z0H8U2_9ACTN|nr:prenyltransferase/squalene oxidase repeat-containing protein [Streptomyces palmae]TGB07910.1 hypothetical protein E4099_16375 [Streptomyces palmae]